MSYKVMTGAVAGAVLLAASTTASAQSVDMLRRQTELLNQQLQQVLRELDAVKAKQAAAEKAAMAPAPQTVKSGNKNVSLEVSGQVNRAVMFADDGQSSDTFFVDNDVSSTRFRFVGKGKLNSDITAGTTIEVEISSNDSDDVSINSPGSSGGDNVFGGIRERKMEVWFASKAAGKIYLGQGDMASNGVAEVGQSAAGVAGGYSDVAKMGGKIQFINSATWMQGGGGLEVEDAFRNLDGHSRRDRVRYDTPSLAGFKVGVSMGQDDRKDVALSYSGKFSGVSLQGKVAYFSEDNSDNGDGYAGSVSVKLPAGFNAAFAIGKQEAGASPRDDRKYWYGQLGWDFKFTMLGTTGVSIDYYNGDNMIMNDDDSRAFGIFAVQKISKLAAEIYAGYRNFKYDQPSADFESVDVGWVGSRIKF